LPFRHPLNSTFHLGEGFGPLVGGASDQVRSERRQCCGRAW
jgi:hypothetical protein